LEQVATLVDENVSHSTGRGKKVEADQHFWPDAERDSWFYSGQEKAFKRWLETRPAFLLPIFYSLHLG